jgi:hypothetical protein
MKKELQVKIIVFKHTNADIEYSGKDKMQETLSTLIIQ